MSYGIHPPTKVDASSKGEWIVRKDQNGVTHLAWLWHGGATIGYLCCVDPDLLAFYTMPTPEHDVTCLACNGTTV